MDLNKFNVLIGACGSGKTNFVQVFELLNDLAYDFHDAINKQGGTFVKNFNLLENDLKSCIEVKFSDINQSITLGQKKDILFSFNTANYEICFNFDKNECKVQNELVKLFKGSKKFLEDIISIDEQFTVAFKNMSQWILNQGNGKYQMVEVYSGKDVKDASLGIFHFLTNNVIEG